MGRGGRYFPPVETMKEELEKRPSEAKFPCTGCVLQGRCHIRKTVLILNIGKS